MSMYIGQTLFANSAAGVDYFTPWFPINGDDGLASYKIYDFFGSFTSVVATLETKNTEDPDSGASILVAITCNVVANTVSSGAFVGALELGRWGLHIDDNQTDNNWVHSGPLAIAFAPN